MKTKSTAKWLRISPRKLARVAEIVRGKTAVEALELLALMPQKGATLLKKVIKSALANAKNNHKVENEAGLKIDQVFVNKGIVMRRWRAAARGRVAMRQKRTSHVTVWLAQEESN